VRGIALIAVLWLVALLTLLATAAATISVSHRRATQRLADAASLDALADSGIRLTALRIIAPPLDGAKVGAGDISLQLFGSPVNVKVERERGRIDINAAEDHLLFALFAANGMNEQAAHTAVARIADWKDTDNEPRTGGAERDAYSQAARRYVPRNAPFESVEELRQVLGLESMSTGILDSLTVYTHAQTPLTDAAREPVMRALRFADKRQLGEHRWLPVEEGNPGSGPNPVADQNLVGEVVRISACARNQKFERCRSTVMHLTGSTRTPFLIFAWQIALPPP
jgi:general secretion pathway protein K